MPAPETISSTPKLSYAAGAAAEITERFSSELKKSVKENTEDSVSFSQDAESKLNLDFTNMTRKEMMAAVNHLVSIGVLTKVESWTFLASDTLILGPNGYVCDPFGNEDKINFIDQWRSRAITSIKKDPTIDSSIMKIVEFMETDNPSKEDSV